MADQSVRDPFPYEAPQEGELKGHLEEESMARVCLITFAASIAATLVICGLTPVRPSPEVWQRVELHRSSNSAIKANCVKPDYTQ